MIKLNNTKLIIAASFLAGLCASLLLSPNNSEAKIDAADGSNTQAEASSPSQNKVTYSDATKQELDKFYQEKKKILAEYKTKKEAMKSEINNQIKSLEGNLSEEAKKVIQARKDKYSSKNKQQTNNI